MFTAKTVQMWDDLLKVATAKTKATLTKKGSCITGSQSLE